MQLPVVVMVSAKRKRTNLNTENIAIFYILILKFSIYFIIYTYMVVYVVCTVAYMYECDWTIF